MIKKTLYIKDEYIEKANNAFNKLGITKKIFAEMRLNVSLSTVFKFFKGKPISQEIFIKICNSLKLDWQEITGLKENNEINSLEDI